MSPSQPYGPRHDMRKETQCLTQLLLILPGPRAFLLQLEYRTIWHTPDCNLIGNNREDLKLSFYSSWQPSSLNTCNGKLVMGRHARRLQISMQASTKRLELDSRTCYIHRKSGAGCKDSDLGPFQDSYRRNGMLSGDLHRFR